VSRAFVSSLNHGGVRLSPLACTKQSVDIEIIASLSDPLFSSSVWYTESGQDPLALL